MRISDVSFARLLHPWKTRVYVTVRAGDLIGIGESTLGQWSQAVVGALRDLRPLLIGHDTSDIDGLRRVLERHIYADGGQIGRAAFAGVEMALWDINARAADRPLVEILGRRLHSRLRLYANGWYRAKRDPEGIGALARAMVERGYTALKIDPFGSGWHDIPEPEIDLAVAILGRVREALGEDRDLIVEAHSRFDAEGALRLAERLAPLRPLWLEEPLSYTDLDGYATVARNTAVPIAAGESLWRHDQFKTLLDAAPIPIVQFDPTHVGGIAASIEICELAEARGAVIAPHCASGLVNEVAAAHVLASRPSALVLEHFERSGTDPDDGLFRTSARVNNGEIELGSVPGLGIEFDAKAITSLHSDAPAVDQDLFAPGWELRGTAR